MLASAALVLAATTLLGGLAFAVDAARGRAMMVFLRREPDPTADELASFPRLSVVFAARNETGAVREAVESMLALEYPDLEVVAVNDRSDDETGVILDAMAAADSRLRVLHITELPDGWLGKNHALWRGADVASGDYLLFTDADVIFEPVAAARAVRWMVGNDVDHFAGATDIVARGVPLQLFVATFAFFFSGYFRPWRAANPNSRGYAGFGGFNLVRRVAYERAGTHRALALDPLDDVNLGRAIKYSGGRQVCGVPGSLARVQWYPTLGEAIRGLEKNTMAGVSWSFALLFGGMAAQLAVCVWPFAALWLTDGPTWWLNAAIVALLLLIHGGMLAETSLPTWLPVLLPVGVLLVVWTYLRAAALTYWRGGIYWRGTFYTLAELRGRDG